MNSTEPLKSSNWNCFSIASPSRSQPSKPVSFVFTSSSLIAAIVTPMRIASLVPSATEMICALGLRDSLVAVTHECDYPEGIELLPHLTRSVIPEYLSPGEIDAAVKSHTEKGEAIYELDEDVLHDLEPDLIVTQALCEVCAVSYDDVRAVAERLPSKPRVIALDPKTFGETLGDIKTIAQATDAQAAALLLVASTSKRMSAVQDALAGPLERPRAARLEWPHT